MTIVLVTVWYFHGYSHILISGVNKFIGNIFIIMHRSALLDRVGIPSMFGKDFGLNFALERGQILICG